MVYDKPLPIPTPVSSPFWKALRDHRIEIQYSPSTLAWVFYPRILAPGSLADDLVWLEIPGTGHIYTFTVALKPTAPPWTELPQLLAVVELDEGPRLTTELVNVAPSDVHVGMRVSPVFWDVPGEDVTLLKYEPAENP